MNSGSLKELAATLPQVWQSRLIGNIGQANIKLIKMGGEAIPWEVHDDFDELLVVIEGNMWLVTDQNTFHLTSGEYYLVPKGIAHKVLPPSQGTLLLVDAQ